METDKHYFVEGLFIIGIAVAAAFFSVWLVSSGHRDDVIYRIHFAESVSGLALGVARDAETVDATMIAPPRPTATSRATRTIRRFAGGSSDLLTAQHVTRRPSAMRASGLH